MLSNFIYISHAAVLSSECLSILLKSVQSLLFGKGIGIDKESMKALIWYYNGDSELVISHMICTWLRSEPEDPVEELRNVLNAQENHEIAQRLVLLSSSCKSK